MPNPKTPELAAERIEWLRDYCKQQYPWSYPEGEFAQTTLALIDSRERALELIRRVWGELAWLPYRTTLTDEVQAFLEHNDG